MARPNTIWAAALNLSGLWGPVKMTWRNDLGEWYDRSGNFSAAKLGLQVKHGITTFASANQKEVKIWVSGVKTVMAHLAWWSGGGC